MASNIKCPNPKCGEERLYQDGQKGLYPMDTHPRVDSATEAHWHWNCDTCKQGFTVRYDLVVSKIERWWYHEYRGGNDGKP